MTTYDNAPRIVIEPLGNQQCRVRFTWAGITAWDQACNPYDAAERATVAETVVERVGQPWPIDMVSTWILDAAKPHEAAASETYSKALTVRQLLATYPTLRRPVIEGLLRVGETMNVISAPKIGKSWLVVDLALSLATGRPWLGIYNTTPGKVLIIDNELHGETTTNRIPKVADARQISLSEYGDRIHVENVRGKDMDLRSYSKLLRPYEPKELAVVIIDAMYRALPPGTDENDNGAMTALYNVIDRYSVSLDCAFVLIHHSSKGNQSGKAVTDVGSGAGSQSRATDTHLVLRPHAQLGAFVVDAAVRSWRPIEPAVLRWTFPVWNLADDLDPADLKPDRPPRRKPAEPQEAAPRGPAWTLDRFVSEFLSPDPQSKSLIIAKAIDAGLTETRAVKWLDMAIECERVFPWARSDDRRKRDYSTQKPPSLNYPD